jgi:riboflavin synthase
MKSRIISLTVLALSVCLLPQAAKAQVAASNPLEWTALAEGNDLINKQIEKQIKGQTQTALLQNTIAAEFNWIHKWEKQYNSYLKTASGYASSLKACTHLYNDGVRIFLTLGKLCKAVRNNPQGIVASIGMNNLYIETATELVSVFTLLNDAVAKGGAENMLTGAERSKTLWALNDQLAAFSRKLHLLYLSIRYYTLNDMWNNVTAGMLDRDNGEVARMALSHWRRAAALAR